MCPICEMEDVFEKRDACSKILRKRGYRVDILTDHGMDILEFARMERSYVLAWCTIDGHNTLVSVRGPGAQAYGDVPGGVSGGSDENSAHYVERETIPLDQEILDAMGYTCFRAAISFRTLYASSELKRRVISRCLACRRRV